MIRLVLTYGTFVIASLEIFGFIAIYGYLAFF